MDSYKDLLPQSTLRFIPFCLSLSDLHHCQRVHKLHRGYKLRSPGFVLGELEDEHDLHRNVWFFVLQRAVGNRLRQAIVSISHFNRRISGMSDDRCNSRAS